MIERKQLALKTTTTTTNQPNQKKKKQTTTTKKKQEKRESRAKQERAVLFDQRLSQHFKIPIRPGIR